MSRDSEGADEGRCRRPDERAEEIIAAAETVFARDGLARARMEEIARQASVSKGTIYLYFSGKDDLFRTMVRSRMEKALEGLSTSTGTDGPAGPRLRRFTRALWEHLRRPLFVDMYRLVLGELHQFPELAAFYSREVAGRIRASTARILKDGMDDGSFVPADPDVAARMVVGLLIQHAVWRGRQELFPRLAGETDEEMLGHIQDFIEAALTPKSHDTEKEHRT